MPPVAVDSSIDVDLPVRSVYNEWTMFEEFPKFMEGIEQVEQLTPDRLHWVAKIGGRRRGVERKIIEQQPDRRIVWQSDAGEPNIGAVEFRPLGNGDRTRVSVHMEYEPQDPLETAADMIGVVNRRVEGDLQRFKQYIESIGHEGGGWRGTLRPEPQYRPRARELAGKAERASSSRARTLFSDAIAGAVGGAIGTLPLTVGLMTTKRRRPWWERSALRQTEVTEHLVTKLGYASKLGDDELEALTIALHTGYGVTMGALYGVAGGRMRLPAPLSGALWGAGVWAASYLGWIPATGLARSARRDRRQMNALMLSSNVLWGIVTALFVAGRRRQSA